MKEALKLTQFQKDILKEVANIGSGNAATVLSNILKERVDVDLSMAEVVELDNISSTIDKKEKLAGGIYLTLSGDIRGLGVFYLMRDGALFLADLLAGKELGSTKILTDLDRSHLKEIGLILNSSYINAMSTLSGLTVLPSAPKFVFEHPKELVAVINKEAGVMKNRGPIICVSTEMTLKNNVIKGVLLILLESDAWSLLVNTIEKRVK